MVYDLKSIRILHNMVSEIFLVVGLRTRMWDPCAYVVLWAPENSVCLKLPFSKRGKLNKGPA